MSDIDKQLEHIYLNVNGKKAFIEATKALISTAVREARIDEVNEVEKTNNAIFSHDPAAYYVNIQRHVTKRLAQLKEGVQE